MNADQKLAAIRGIFETLEQNADGTETTDHAYYNLGGAISDIERTGECDAVCLSTLNRVHDQLGQIGRVLYS
jgi:hypothetical protein